MSLKRTVDRYLTICISKSSFQDIHISTVRPFVSHFYSTSFTPDSTNSINCTGFQNTKELINTQDLTDNAISLDMSCSENLKEFSDASSLSSQLISLLSDSKPNSELIFSTFKNVNEILSLTISLPLLRFVIQQKDYKLANKVFLDHFATASSLFTVLTISDWENLFILADANGDIEGQAAYLIFLLQTELKPTTTVLHSLLSCALVATAQGNSISVSKISTIRFNRNSSNIISSIPLTLTGNLDSVQIASTNDISSIKQNLHEAFRILSKKHISSSDWIMFILNLFKQLQYPLSSTTVEIIMSHCVLTRNWKVVTELLNPSIDIYRFISPDLFEFILYEMGVERLPRLISVVWKKIIDSNIKTNLTLHQIALDAIILSADPSTALDGYKIYSKLLQTSKSIQDSKSLQDSKFLRDSSTFASPDKGDLPHPAMLLGFGHRLCSFLLTSTRFDILLATLIEMHRHSLDIPSSLFFRVFDGIIQYSYTNNSTFNGFDRLGAFLSSFHQEFGPDVLGPDIRAALIKLSTRHIIPSSFLDHLERLELSH